MTKRKNVIKDFKKDIETLEQEVKNIKVKNDAEKVAQALEKFFEKNSDDVNFLKSASDCADNVTAGDYFHKLMEIHHLVKKEIKYNSEQNETNFYRIFSGKTKRPAREKIIAIALAMGLNRVEVDLILFLANVSTLCVRNCWDAVIIYAIENKKSVRETQDILHELNAREKRATFQALISEEVDENI